MSVMQGTAKASDFNPFRPMMGYVCNQLMFNFRSVSLLYCSEFQTDPLTQGPFMMMLKDYPNTDAAVANVLAFFGRHISDQDFLGAISDNTEKLNKASSWKLKLIMPFVMIYMLFFGCKAIPKIEKQVFEENATDMTTPLKNVPLKDKLMTFFHVLSKTFHVMQVHGASAFGSSLKSQLMMKILKNTSDSSNVDADVNLLMSHCNDVVSAEVPNMLRDIARAVKDKQSLCDLSDEDALQALRSSVKEPQASELFAKFLRKHGHRGYREFDPLYLTWGKNPIPCVQVIKVSRIENTDYNLITKRNMHSHY